MPSLLDNATIFRVIRQAALCFRSQWGRAPEYIPGDLEQVRKRQYRATVPSYRMVVNVDLGAKPFLAGIRQRVPGTWPEKPVIGSIDHELLEEPKECFPTVSRFKI